MKINRTDLDRIRADRAVLVSALQDAGATVNGQAKIHCPFHDDRNPSGSLKNSEDGVWRYHCFACTWNDGQSGGDAFDVMKKRGRTFAEAARELGCTDTTDDGPTESKSAIKHEPEDRPKSTPAVPPEDQSKLATESAARLQGDGGLLEKLWLDRGVDRETAKRFGVGVDAENRYWTFPVEVDGRIAIKHHRVEPGDGLKCFWKPEGTNARNCWPVCLDYPGPVSICPGELKALAVIAAGRSAIGITSGETASLPLEIIDRLGGRSAALPCDDDEAGRKWGAESLKFFKNHGTDALTVTLPLDSAAGLNDVGDYIVSLIENGKSPDEIGATLDSWYQKSDPWAGNTIGALLTAPETWEPVEYVPSGLTRFDELSGGGNRVKAVTLIVGPSGKGKTQVAVQMAHNAAAMGIPVGIISLEMTKREITHLVAGQSADIPRSWLEKGDVHGPAADRLSNAQQRLKDAPLIVLDDDSWSGGLDRDGLASIVKRGAKRYGWRLVLLDYLGLLAPADGDQTEFTADLRNSTSLKRIARQCDVALLVVAALRKTAKNDSTPITLHDVLGAGRLVYDAASVWAVQSEQVAVPAGGNPTGIVTLIPLKSRFSGCAAQGLEVQLRWQPGFGSVHNLKGGTI